MPAAKTPRGATAIRSDQFLPRKHLLAAGGLSVCVVFLVLFNIGIRVEQKPPTVSVTELATPGPTDAFATSLVDTPSSAAEILNNTTPEQEPVEEEGPQWKSHTVRSGDNLSLIFKRAGYYDRDIYAITNHARDGKSLTKIFPGQRVEFLAGEDGKLEQLRYVVSKLETVTYSRTLKGFESAREIRTPEIRQAWATAKISSSLFLAGQKAGLSQAMIMEMANIFGGVIDFVLDPRIGDTVHILYEDLYVDGEKYGDGKILATSFTNQGKTFNAYRYEDAHGDVNYYNENGISMRKAFLLAPVDFTRISSNFNMKRLHPIYKTTRPHRGTDYAASTGTPVYAAGDGTVQKAGYSGANGNYVFIQHGKNYVTKYLHLHKRSVKAGQRVVQSQVIGTVGATGAATGPHLHYEFLVNGVHRNPRTIHSQLPKAKSLASTEMPRYRAAIASMSNQLAALQSNNHLAMNQSEANPRL